MGQLLQGGYEGKRSRKAESEVATAKFGRHRGGGKTDLANFGLKLEEGARGEEEKVQKWRKDAYVSRGRHSLCPAGLFVHSLPNMASAWQIGGEG